MTTDAPGGWGRTVSWAHLLLAPVVFSTATTEAFERPKVALLHAAALLLLGLGAVRLRRPDPASAAVAAVVATAALSTAFALDPRTSLLGMQGSFRGLLTLAAVAVLFAAGRRFCADDEGAWSVLSALVPAIGIAVVYGLLQAAGLDPVPWRAPIRYGSVARVFSTQGHPAALAQLLAMAAPLLLARVLATRGARRLSAALVAAGALVVLPLTWSRAGLLAAAIGVVAVVPRLGLLALPALAAVPMAGRFAEDLASDPRQHLWSAAVAIFREHPWLGVGPDAFGLAFGAHRTAAAWAAEWGQTPLSAHNQLLDVLAMQGALGASATLALLALLAVAVVRRWSDPLLRACGAALLAFAVHLQFHFPTAATWSLAALLGGIVSARAWPPAPSREWRWPVAIALTLAYVLVLRPLRADVLAAASTRSPALASSAVALDPSRELTWSRLSVAELRAGRLVEARKAAEEALRRAPLWPYAHAHLGRVLSEMERARPPLATRAEAEAAFTGAAALDPMNAHVHMAAANAALAAGDLASAERWASRCAALYPDFAAPRGVLGAVHLARARATGSIVERDLAAGLLREALAGQWHGDADGLAAATANLRALMEEVRLSGAATPAPPAGPATDARTSPAAPGAPR